MNTDGDDNDDGEYGYDPNWKPPITDTARAAREKEEHHRNLMQQAFGTNWLLHAEAVAKQQAKEKKR